MLEPHPHDGNAALKVTVSALISFAIMVVEFVWFIRDEIKYVWPRLRSSWIAWIYMIARYVGLASQIFSIYFSVRMYMGVYTSPAGCHIWFLFQATVVQFLLAFVEGLLMHRIYDLFLRDRLILVILITFAIGQTASMGVSARLTYPSNKHTVTCLVMRSNPGSAFFSATTMTTNVIIFFMTFWRYLRLPARWTRHGLGRVVLRDSALSLGAISVMMLFLTLCSLQVIKPTMSGNITYYWLVCILWVSVGRIILNHEKIPRDNSEQGEGSTWKGTLQLTSQIEMGESILSLDTECGSLDQQTPSSSTLRSSFSTPVTKASQLSRDGTPNRLGDHSPVDGHGHQDSLRPSSTGLSEEVPIPHASNSGTPTSDTEPSVEVPLPNASQLSLPNVCTSDGDAPQTDDRLQPDSDADADADTGGRVHHPGPDSQISDSESPPSEPS